MAATEKPPYPTAVITLTPAFLSYVAAHDDQTLEVVDRECARWQLAAHVAQEIERAELSVVDTMGVALRSLTDETQRVVLHLVVSLSERDAVEFERAVTYLRAEIKR